MAKRTCSLHECGNPHHAHGLCAVHAARLARTGDPRGVRRKRNTCTVDGCDDAVEGRGLCNLHYRRWRRHGDPTATAYGSLAERFWEKVDVGHPLGCWEWTAARGRADYGRFNAGGRMVQAHRWAYERLRGPIPDGLHLDHLCRNPPCVNPDHLEPVTTKENLRRGYHRNAGKTRCKRGHEFVPDNTYVTSTGGRKCRACARLYRSGDAYAARA